LCHLIFNVTGILLFYTIPFMRWPLPMCKALGNTTAEYRWFAIFYLIMVFFVAPAILLGLSVISTWAMVSLVLLILVVVIFVLIVNVLQERRPSALPTFLRSWKFLPEPLRSLGFYDRVFTKSCGCCKVCQKKEEAEEDEIKYSQSSEAL